MNKNKENNIAGIEVAIEYLRAGRMIILVDDEDRENEGDLCIAAQKVTPEAINFMAKHGRGLICLALSAEIAKSLELQPMTSHNTSIFGTAFTVSIDAKEGITTGISAKDRTTTILKSMEDGAKKEDFVSPGHVFPIVAKKGGVLVRAGQTEGSVDLANLAGFKGGAVICEIMDDDGTMMRLPNLLKFGRKYDIPVYTIENLIKFRLKTESFIRKISSANLETEYGDFQIHAFENEIDSKVHIALICGKICKDEEILVRVHKSNILNDVFNFRGSHKRREIELALKMISNEGKGVFLYLCKEEKGAELVENPQILSKNGNIEDSLKNLVHSGEKLTFREFGIGAQILKNLGLRKIKIITNHPKKIKGLQGFGLEITQWVKLE